MALFSRDATTFGPGDLIADRYKITGILGRGGFGTVYAGEHTGTRQHIAIKMLASEAGVDGEAMERFYREAQITAQLTHPNTVRVFDVGRVDDGPLYLVMEMLRGPTLEQILASLKAKGLGMSETQAIALMLPILSSLAEAHSAGLVHRDLKPANLMIHDVAGSEPVVKVLDFGCSHTHGSELTAQGAVLGTPGYMSPEQCRGDDVMAPSDLYSIAVILYRCVTGLLPFDTNQPLQLIYKHAHEAVPDPRDRADRHVSNPMAEVLLRSLSKQPGDRFKSAREMRNALENIRTKVNNAPVNLHGDGRTHIAGSPADSGRQLISLMLLSVDGYQPPEQFKSDNVRASATSAPNGGRDNAPPATQAYSANPLGGGPMSTDERALISAATVADPNSRAVDAPLADGPQTVLREPAQAWHEAEATGSGDSTMQSSIVAETPKNRALAAIAVVLLLGLAGGAWALFGGPDPAASGEMVRAADTVPKNVAAATVVPDEPALSGAEMERQSEVRMASRHVDLARASTDLDARVRHLIAAVRLAPNDEKYAAELKAAQALLTVNQKMSDAQSALEKRQRRKPRRAAAPRPTPPAAAPSRPKSNRIPAAILEE